MPAKKKKKTQKSQGRFEVWTYNNKTGKPRTLARFHVSQAARDFARIASIEGETSVYVDEILGKNKGEPIATYMSGMSMRI